MKQIVVTAAIIINEGKILLAQRKPGSNHELLWEFPGGKLEPDEEPIAGLKREIKEELDLEITVGDIFQVEWDQQAEQTILFLFYRCEYAGGIAKTVDCHDFNWTSISELADYQFPPADQAVVDRLQVYDNTQLRSQRKQEHIQTFLNLPCQPISNDFNDIRLVHCALPELAWEDVNLCWEVFGKSTSAPLLINALTGGSQQVEWINRALARCARESGLAMAVGSQTAALFEPSLSASFRVVREENPDGVVLANVGAGIDPAVAAQAVEMLNADALQIHLNVPQELTMQEGERNFRGWSDNIAAMVKYIQVPIIVKEVGFGLSKEVLQELKSLGVTNFDVGGYGGTNFITIEQKRSGSHPTGLEDWGIPTACSTIEAFSEGIPGELIATGGISSPLDAAKALALGATAIGVAGHFLRTLCQQSEGDLLALLEQWKLQLKQIYLMCGARNNVEMRQTPLVLTGLTKEWAEQRRLNTELYSNRKSKK